jgi:hypothetical protein
MTRLDDYKRDWCQRRPHLPYKLVDGTISATSLEMLINPEVWAVKRGDTMYDMSQPLLCGFFVPPFQRPLVWDEARMVAFVESAYLGLHLGTLVYNDAMDLPMSGGKFHRTDRWLIDGQQRCNALWQYVNDAFPVFTGTSHEHRWSDLNELEQRTFGMIQIGYTKLTTGDEHELRTVYDRLNFGGVPHTEDQRALPA